MIKPIFEILKTED